MAHPPKWSDAQLRRAVASSTNTREVMGKLGLSTGGSSESVRRRIGELGLDTSHFQRNRGIPGTRKPVRPTMVEHGRRVEPALRDGWTPDPQSMDDAKAEELIENLGRAAAGVSEADIEAAAARGTGDGERRPLTASGAEVLQLIADGLGTQEVAEKLGITEDSVYGATAQARFSLDAATLEEAVAKATGARLIRARRQGTWKPPAAMLAVAQGYANGLVPKQIQAELSLSKGRASDYIEALRFFVGARTTRETVAILVERGMIVGPALPAYATEGYKPGLNATPRNNARQLAVEAADEGELHLSPRDLTVVREIVAGRSNAEIAETIGLTEYGTADIVKVLLARFGARNRVQLAVRAVREGLA